MKPVVCPQCGTALDRQSADEQARLQCGKCGRRLKLARKRDLRTPGAEAAASPTASLPPTTVAKPAPLPLPPVASSPPRRTDTDAPRRDSTNLLPPPGPLSPTGRSAPATSPAEAISEPGDLAQPSVFLPQVTSEVRTPKSAEEVLSEAAARRASRQRLAAAGLTFLVAACLVAVYFIFNPPQLVVSAESRDNRQSSESSPPPALAKENSETASAHAADTAPDAQPSRDAEPDLQSQTAQPPPPSDLAPITWGNLQTVSRRDLEKLWTELQPYVFRLKAERPSGVQTLSGVLIDSRGWVVTSLSAVTGATAIEVAPGPLDPLSDLPADTLRDQVRGILATDPVHDLVLLQINRRLVNVVTNLQPSDQRLVPGRSLFQAVAVGPERRAWLSEARVARTDPGNFSSELSQTIARRGLDLAPYWPGHDAPLSNGAGAALFTSDGRLGGLNIGLSAEGVHYFVETRWLEELASRAREPALPLDSLTESGSKASSESAQTVPAGNSPSAKASASAAGASPFPAGHEAEPIAGRLATAAQACEAFDWLPETDASHQATLTEALSAWREARGWVRARRLFPEDAEKLSRQVAHWTGRVKATLLGLDRDQTTQFNREAWDSLGSQAPETRAFFARVVLQPGTSPRVGGLDTATLELLGLEQFIVATVDPDLAPLLPESEWLVVVTVDPKEETLVSPQAGRQANARRGTALREISEIKSIGLRLEAPGGS